MLEMLDQPLGVVPIVVNAGTALLPAIVAGAVSIVSVLFRPSQWGRVVREKPWVPVILLLGMSASVGAYFWLAGAEDATASAQPVRGRATAGAGIAAGGSVDWTAVALEYIRDKQRRPVAAPAANGTAATAPEAANADKQPFVFRADMQRSGAFDSTSPTKLQEAWRWTDPEDPFAMYCSSLATDGANLYGAAATLTPPDSRGAVVSLDARTGQLRWVTFETTDDKGATIGFKGFFSSPALTADGKYVIIGEGLHTDKDSAMICLEAATGKVVWRIPTTQHLESSPAIEGDIVVIGAGAIERAEDHKVPPGGNPGFVLAVQISTGKELWRHQVNDPESTPAIKDGIVYIGSGVNGSEVVALRIDSEEDLKAKGLQREVWRTKTPYPALAAVTVAGDLVLIGCGDGDFIRPGRNGVVLALDRKTGKIQWQTDAQTTPASVLSPVAVRGNVAVAGVGNGEVVALDLAQQGKLLWRSKVSDAAAVNAGPAITDTHVYALSADGWLGVYDRKTGEQLERHFVNNPAKPGELGMSVSGPVIAGGRVYVGSESGGIRAYEGGAQ
jgi:outer membrane protein assembly factor BamB